MIGNDFTRRLLKRIGDSSMVHGMSVFLLLLTACSGTARLANRMTVDAQRRIADCIARCPGDDAVCEQRCQQINVRPIEGTK